MPAVPARLAVRIGVLLALAVPSARSQVEGHMLNGAVADMETGQAYLFHVTPDSVLHLQNIGRISAMPTPINGLPEGSRDPSTTVLDIPLDNFRVIADRVDDTIERPEIKSRVGYSIDPRGLRIMFEQGIPIWAAVAGAIASLLVGGAFVGGRLWRRERRRQQSEAEARLRALQAREAERTRLAREIHDGPLQDVHALRLLPADTDLSGEATRIARELRAIAEGLRPPALGRFGLAAALAAHAARVKERYPGVEIGLDLDEDGPQTLPELTRAAFFRVAQEAVTNAVEHGRAQRVHIALRLPGGGVDPGATREPSSATQDLRLEVLDDGEGLPWGPRGPDLEALVEGGHFGLVGMYERASAVGGTLTLDGDGIDGRGVRLLIEAPALGSPPRVRRARAVA